MNLFCGRTLRLHLPIPPSHPASKTKKRAGTSRNAAKTCSMVVERAVANDKLACEITFSRSRLSQQVISSKWVNSLWYLSPSICRVPPTSGTAAKKRSRYHEQAQVAYDAAVFNFKKEKSGPYPIA
jgi:hypothetical protein